jgi:hypothetical protein
MKKIHTPINKSIGNQEMNTCERKDCSSGGFVIKFNAIIDQITNQTAIKNRELGFNFLPSVVTAVTVRVGIVNVASLICFALTSSKSRNKAQKRQHRYFSSQTA